MASNRGFDGLNWNGRVEAELLDDELKPIEGYRREECRAFSGDDKAVALTWKDHERVDVGKAHLRVILTDARLYGFDWR